MLLSCLAKIWNARRLPHVVILNFMNAKLFWDETKPIQEKLFITSYFIKYRLNVYLCQQQDLGGSTKMPDLSELVGGGTLKRPGPSPVIPPSRSRSISSEMEVPRVISLSPHGSSDHLETSSPTHYSRWGHDLIVYYVLVSSVPQNYSPWSYFLSVFNFICIHAILLL